MKNRIAITGYGIKTPGANNNKEFEMILRSGEKQTELDDSLFPDNIVCRVGKVNDDLEYLGKIYKKYPRFAKLAMATTIEALEMAKLTDLKNKKVGIFFGTTLGGTEGYEEAGVKIAENNFKNFPIHLCGKTHYHSVSSAIASLLDIQVPTKTISTGCTAGIEALEIAMLYLEANKIDIAIVGGSDASNSKYTHFGFGKTRSLPFNQLDNFAGTPFTKKSKGFIVSEGSGTLIIEKESHVKKRNGKIFGYVEDILSNNDAVNIFFSDNSGEPMYNILKQLKMKKTPDYINSQALGLKDNDLIEYNNSKKLYNHEVPISSIKGIIGHPLSASGIAQIIASLIGFEKDFIFPTLHTDKDGFEDLNLIQKLEQRKNSNALITSHGYGGNNAAVFVSKE